jgi:hypothetical protein
MAREIVAESWLSPDRSWVLIAEMKGSTDWQRCRVVPMDGYSAGVQVGPEGACTAAAWSPDDDRCTSTQPSQFSKSEAGTPFVFSKGTSKVSTTF